MVPETKKDYLYSTDMIKKAAFIDELNNILKITPVNENSYDIEIVIQYIQKRLKQIDEKYK